MSEKLMGSTWADLDDLLKKETPEEFEEWVKRSRKARQWVFGEDFSETIFQEDVERVRVRKAVLEKRQNEG